VSERLIVVGADAAGMSAASQARRRRGADELEILVFERGHFTSYSACGIPYFVGNVVEDIDRLIVRTPDEFRAKQQIEVRTRHEVVSIDLDARKVVVRDLDSGDEVSEGFDLLMYAAGGKPGRPELPGIDSAGVFGVQVLDDGVAIERWVEDGSPKHAVVVGGGYIGIEMAEAFIQRGLKVSLVERAQEPMSTLDPDMGALVREALVEEGVEVFTKEAVTAFETANGKVTAVITDRRTLQADIVTLGLGTRPNSDLARDSGIPIGPSGGVVVDRQMKTEIDGVWSAGDCAEKFHLVSRKPVAIALGTHANKEGRVAGINIGGGYATFPGVLGTAVSKLCGVEVARTGLKEDEALDAGFDIEIVSVDSTTRAGYFPGTQPIKIKLIVEKRSGRLLGAQILGKENAGKRIDALAVALFNEMTVGEMLNMDLSYAPPFAPVWDPVLIAARKAYELVERTASEYV
jgi:NADPH-dependent 2,4-dienoyl-CoA reductase/sulfur reductase-like enzyme